MCCALLADDNPTFRDSLRRILARHFPLLHVMEAGTGAQAMTLSASGRPHLVFMDIRFPDANGLILTRAIKAMYPVSTICVLTQYDIPEYRQAARDCGADRFMIKDETTEDAIVEVVAAVLSGRFAPADGERPPLP